MIATQFRTGKELLFINEHRHALMADVDTQCPHCKGYCSSILKARTDERQHAYHPWDMPVNVWLELRICGVHGLHFIIENADA